MKRFAVFMLCFLAVVVAGYRYSYGNVIEQVEKDVCLRDGAKRITYTQFIKIRDSGEKYILADVLPSGSYGSGHIAGAIAFPLNMINEDSAKKLLAKDMYIITYCQGFQCPDSTVAARRLSGFGYKVFDYKGGLDEWQDKGNKLVK
jgi:rhodanese-related sulfurtransferase